MKHTVFQLGEWRVEPDLKRLSKDGKTVEVEPKTMAVLVFMIEHVGEVVSSSELIKAIWDDRPMGDNPVYKAIAKLRNVLGDNPHHPEFIATVTRVGYRLVAPVAPAAPTSEMTNGDRATTRRHARQYISWRSFLVYSIVLLVVLLVWPELEGWKGRLDTENLTPRIQQLVTLPGSSSQATFSPEGQQLVFVNDSDGVDNLWALTLGQVAAQQLTFFKDPVSSPAWPPSGQGLLFVQNGSVWQVQVDLQSDADFEPQLLIEHALFPAWSDDGQQIVFERGAEVWIATANGDEQRRITAISSQLQLFAPRFPRFSPDSRSLVFFDAVQGPVGDFWVVDIESNVKRQITFDNVLAGKAQFSQDGRWIVFDSTRNGSQSIWRVPVNGGAPQQMLHSTSNYMLSTLGPNSHSLVYTSTSPQWSLMLSNPENDSEEVLYSSRLHTMAPELSPDGSQLAFFAGSPDGSTHIYTLSMTSRITKQLTAEPQTVNAIPKWSGDSNWIYYYHSGKDNNSSWRRVHVETGKSEVVEPGWEFNHQHDATIDPTGKKIVYAQLEGSNVVASKVKILKSGAELPIVARLSWPEWSSDGSRLLATDFSATPLPVGPVLLCELEGEMPDKCKQIAVRGQHPLWSSNERSAYYVDPVGASQMEIWRHDFSLNSNEMVKLLSPTATEIAPFFDVTADNDIVWTRFEKGRSELWQMTW